MCNLLCPVCSPCAKNIWLVRDDLCRCCHRYRLRVGSALFAVMFLVMDAMMLSCAVLIALNYPFENMIRPYDTIRKPLFVLVAPLVIAGFPFHFFYFGAYGLWFLLDILLLVGILLRLHCLLIFWVVFSLERFIFMIPDIYIIIVDLSFNIKEKNDQEEDRPTHLLTIGIAVYHAISLLLLVLLVYPRYVIKSYAKTVKYQETRARLISALAKKQNKKGGEMLSSQQPQRKVTVHPCEMGAERGGATGEPSATGSIKQQNQLIKYPRQENEEYEPSIKGHRMDAREYKGAPANQHDQLIKIYPLQVNDEFEKSGKGYPKCIKVFKVPPANQQNQGTKISPLKKNKHETFGKGDLKYVGVSKAAPVIPEHENQQKKQTKYPCPINKEPETFDKGVRNISIYANKEIQKQPGSNHLHRIQKNSPRSGKIEKLLDNENKKFQSTRKHHMNSSKQECKSEGDAVDQSSIYFQNSDRARNENYRKQDTYTIQNTVPKIAPKTEYSRLKRKRSSSKKNKNESLSEIEPPKRQRKYLRRDSEASSEETSSEETSSEVLLDSNCKTRRIRLSENEEISSNTPQSYSQLIRSYDLTSDYANSSYKESSRSSKEYTSQKPTESPNQGRIEKKTSSAEVSQSVKSRRDLQQKSNKKKSDDNYKKNTDSRQNVQKYKSGKEREGEQSKKPADVAKQLPCGCRTKVLRLKKEDDDNASGFSNEIEEKEKTSTCVQEICKDCNGQTIDVSQSDKARSVQRGRSEQIPQSSCAQHKVDFASHQDIRGPHLKVETLQGRRERMSEHKKSSYRVKPK